MQRRWTSFLIKTILITICLLAVVATYGWWQLNRTPSYVVEYREAMTAIDPTNLLVLAENVQNRVPTKLTGTGDPQSGNGIELKTITLTLEEINAWLVVKLPAWLENQLNLSVPPHVIETGMAIHRQQPLFFLSFENEGKVQIVTALFSLTILESGMARLQLQQVRLGNLPLPLSLARAALEEQGGPNGSPLTQTFHKLLAGIKFPPVHAFPLDVRQGRLMAVRIHPDKVEFEVQVERIRH